MSTAYLYTLDENGEQVRIGDVIGWQLTPNDDIPPATLVPLDMTRTITWEPDAETFERIWCALRGLNRPRAHHGGQRLHRRKHDGRWHKLDKRGKLPPPWKVRP